MRADDRREVLAAVEALVNNARVDEWRDEAARGKAVLPYASNRYVRLVDDLRAALADPAGALAKHDAEVLRAAAGDYDRQRGIPEGTHVGTWLRKRADRIEAP